MAPEEGPSRAPSPQLLRLLPWKQLVAPAASAEQKTVTLSVRETLKNTHSASSTETA